MKEREDLEWHPAFPQAMQMELFKWRCFLEFKPEYSLNSEPLRMDLLIIVMQKQVSIDKNIARIFKKHNILEYKSPKDYLSVKDFYKVYAYANLYVSINNEVDMSEVSVTFVQYRYPRKLFDYLRSDRNYQVEKHSSGVYHIKGDYVPIQIIVSQELSESENLWLESLRSGLETQSVETILEISRNTDEVFLGAYLDVILRANPEVFLEVSKMARYGATFEEVFTKAGIIPQWIEQGITRGRKEREKEIAINLLAEGWTVEKTAEITRLPLETVRELVSS
jgi:hypothetical protein